MKIKYKGFERVLGWMLGYCMNYTKAGKKDKNL